MMDLQIESYTLCSQHPDASTEDTRKAYRQWAQVYHPDKYQDPQVLLTLSLLIVLFFACGWKMMNWVFGFGGYLGLIGLVDFAPKVCL